MQLKRSTSYALRIVLGLARRQRVAIPEMAEILDVESSYVLKILRKMRNNGFVSSTHGHGGGYELSVRPEEITLWDIISIMEDHTGLNRCLDSDHYCGLNAVETCPVRNEYCQLQAEMENEFKSLTIADLMQESMKEA